jgi:predicted permease
VDAWAPLFAGAYDLPATWTTSYTFRSVTVLGRLQPGVAASTAAEQASAAYRRAVEGTPAADPTAFAVLATLKPGRSQRGELNQSGQIALWIQGVALLVLFVAIANIANLQMSRAAQQRRETAVRVALGASRGRLLTRVSLEMLLIAAAAAAAGLLLTYWSSTSLQQLLLPGGAVFVGHSRMAAVAAVSILATTVVCVVLSAVQVRMGDVGARLKSGRGGEGFSRERFRQALLVSQVVVSTLLLVGAGLFLRSIDALGRLEFGHDQDRILVVTAPMRSAGYSDTAIEGFYTRAIERLRQVPGVEDAAAAQTTPFAPSQAVPIEVPGVTEQPLRGDRFPTFYTVTPAFFDTMGMRVLRGRGFTETDTQGAPLVMVLEQALADAIWPGQDPIGKCLLLGTQNRTCREVVGVVSNTRRFVHTGNNALRYYVPMGQRIFQMTPQAIFVRARDPLSLAPSVRAALLATEPNLPYLRMRALAEMAEPDMRTWRMGSTLFVVFGAAALLVATAGVYALLSFIVAQRTREIGVRLALGANRAGTLALVFRQSLRWVVLGLVIGLGAAVAAGRFMKPMLFETSPYDPAVFAATTALLCVVAIVASLVPAIRASRVDPNVALRVE